MDDRSPEHRENPTVDSGEAALVTDGDPTVDSGEGALVTDEDPTVDSGEGAAVTDEDPGSVEVVFGPVGGRVTVPIGSTILEAGRRAGLILAANCGGHGICGRCRVTVVGPNRPEPVETEARELGDTAVAAGQRLACRSRLRADTEVHVPRTTLGSRQRLQLEGPAPARAAATTGGSLLGVAVDLGCTKIAAYLLDLATGDQLAARGVPNPQISYGEDLVSRLHHAARGSEQARELATVVRGAVNSLVAGLAREAGVELERIVDMTLVGNTAMTQLFLGRPVEGLLSAPFRADTTAADVPARELGIDLPGVVMVHVPPGVGAFVGADHVAVILANGLDRCSHTALGIDIGTNTEVVLSRPDHGLLLTSSTPAGPIFEGGHITCGMRAAPGAVERVLSSPEGPEVRTIGGVAPVGLCGSGVVDAVALMRREGIIDHRGHIVSGAPGVRRGAKGLEFLLVPAARTGHGADLVLTQADVSEVQLAKAAIAAGVRTLLSESGTPVDEVAEVVLAGAFGSYVDVGNAVAIGMLPHLPNAEYIPVGNAAGTGAKMTLVSDGARRQAAVIARRAVHVGLTKLPGFNRELALATQFPTEPKGSVVADGSPGPRGDETGGSSRC